MSYASTLNGCGKTDRGLVRQTNEDGCLCNLSRNLFVVSDGMGGVAGGKVASNLFLQVSEDFFSGSPIHSTEELRNRVRDSFARANSRIINEAREKSLPGMGCTAELLTIHNDETFVLGHVGDSRTYRFRDGTLTRLTTDHSLVQQQLDQGLITREEMAHSHKKNVLLRAVGTQMELTIDILTGAIQRGDFFLLCSDGLHNMVSEEEIRDVLAYDASLELKVDMLIDMANDSGGKDNITVLLIEKS